MKKFLATAAAVAALALLAACSPISSGYITNKDHDEGYYTTDTYCMMYDSETGLCKLYGTRQRWVEPVWRFDIQQDEDKGWVYVSEDTYGNYEVGDYYNVQ